MILQDSSCTPHDSSFLLYKFLLDVRQKSHDGDDLLEKIVSCMYVCVYGFCVCV
jgi:hypothetical protein